jgi:hypothetical protein
VWGAVRGRVARAGLYRLEEPGGRKPGRKGMEWNGEREGMSGGPHRRLSASRTVASGPSRQLPGRSPFAAGFDVSNLVLLKFLSIF